MNEVHQALELLNGFVYPATVTGCLQSFVYDPEAQELIHLPTGTVLGKQTPSTFIWEIKEHAHN